MYLVVGVSSELISDNNIGGEEELDTLLSGDLLKSAG